MEPPNYQNMRNALQEYCQRRAWPLPEYTSVNSGPPHNPRFQVTYLPSFLLLTVFLLSCVSQCTVIVRDNRGRQAKFDGRMQFGKKKDAEQEAASVAFQQINSVGDIFSAPAKLHVVPAAPSVAPAPAVTPPLPTAMPVFASNPQPARYRILSQRICQRVLTYIGLGMSHLWKIRRSRSLPIIRISCRTTAWRIA